MSEDFLGDHMVYRGEEGGRGNQSSLKNIKTSVKGTRWKTGDETSW